MTLKSIATKPQQDVSPDSTTRGGPGDDDMEEVEAIRRLLTADSGRAAREYAAFRETIQKAETLLAAGNYAEAVREYEAASRAFEPNYYFGELYLGLGCAFVGLNQHAHAVTVFDRAIEEDPHNANVYLNKGLALVVLKELPRALETFQKGIEPARQAKETEFAVQLMLYCGQIHEELDNDDAALETYLDALQLASDYSQLWYLAGCIYAKREQKDQAVKFFREAVDCPHPWPSAYYKLSQLVSDPLEKKRLYNLFVDAQQEMAQRGGDAPVALEGGAGLV